MNYEEFSRRLNVSHETFEKLSLYVEKLLKWQKSINLISPTTTPYIWERHILDSANLQNHIPREKSIVDMGTGAGLPGLVLAILGFDVTLIESDQRKAIFLQEVIRELSLPISFHVERCEQIKAETPFDIITSRALAEINVLFQWSDGLRGADSICLFPKGKNYAMEIANAKADGWRFESSIYPHGEGVIVECREVRFT